jgi:hypothetical protein
VVTRAVAAGVVVTNVRCVWAPLRLGGFWADLGTSRRSRPEGPISRCSASARSFTPSGDD